MKMFMAVATLSFGVFLGSPAGAQAPAPQAPPPPPLWDAQIGASFVGTSGMKPARPCSGG